jgi:hypothetical protein
MQFRRLSGARRNEMRDHLMALQKDLHDVGAQADETKR